MSKSCDTFLGVNPRNPLDSVAAALLGAADVIDQHLATRRAPLFGAKISGFLLGGTANLLIIAAMPFALLDALRGLGKQGIAEQLTNTTSVPLATLGYRLWDGKLPSC